MLEHTYTWSCRTYSHTFGLMKTHFCVCICNDATLLLIGKQGSTHTPPLTESVKLVCLTIMMVPEVCRRDRTFIHISWDNITSFIKINSSPLLFGTCRECSSVFDVLSSSYYLNCYLRDAIARWFLCSGQNVPKVCCLNYLWWLVSSVGTN